MGQRSSSQGKKEIREECGISSWLSDLLEGQTNNPIVRSDMEKATTSTSFIENCDEQMKIPSEPAIVVNAVSSKCLVIHQRGPTQWSHPLLKCGVNSTSCWRMSPNIPLPIMCLLAAKIPPQRIKHAACHIEINCRRLHHFTISHWPLQRARKNHHSLASVRE